MRNEKLRTALTGIVFIICLTAFAQRTKTVEAEYTYHAPENVTLEEARRTALTRAKLQAIADEFGTIVQQTNATRISNQDGQSQVDMLSIGGSEVKGEWIETLGEPDYRISYEQGMLVVTCKVKGKAREIVSAQIDLQTHVLRNGTEDKYESDVFKSGDDLYLSFQSPVKGFLSVYLVDDDAQAFCLLPYRNQQDGIYSIEANHRYVFFHEKSAPIEERRIVDEYTMTCSRQTEHNQIYVIFSPNPFAKASDESTSDELPRQLSYKDFQQWLVKQRKHDTTMNVRMIPINISKP